MNIREKILAFLQQTGLLLVLILTAVFVSGCSSKVQTVQFKINSEPEGSHVVLNVSGPKLPNSADWIYLGHTPIRGVRQISEDKVAEANKITLKVMHAGYYDQIREWDGEAFWNEAVERGVIFWTPSLIPHPNSQ
jgi:hypothetical protein